MILKEKRSIALLISILLIASAVFIFLIESPEQEEGAPSLAPQMRVVRVHFSENDIYATDLGLLAGSAKIKRRAPKEGRFFYRVTDERGIELLQGSFPDPRTIFYDFPIDKSGKLSGGSLQQEHAVFDIRLPKIEAGSELELFDHTDSPTEKPILRSQLEPL